MRPWDADRDGIDTDGVQDASGQVGLFERDAFSSIEEENRTR
jgi:hypothetical protein